MATKHEDREPITLYNQGEKLFGIYHKPLIKPPYPAILFCHGLAGHKTGRYRLYVELAEKLTKEGFAVLRFDFRGSGDSEGAIKDLTMTGAVSDAKVAFEWLKDQPDVDKARMGLFGRSFGGTIAIMTAAEVGGCKSLAVWAPLFSGDQWHEKWMRLLNHNMDPAENEELRTINGQVIGLPFYKELFSMDILNSLEGLKGVPLLHLHGLKDDVVIPAHADQYEQARKGCVSRFLIYNESDHDFTFLPERKAATKETINWFKSTL